MYNNIMENKWIKQIISKEKKIYSQANQDGIIEYIFQNIGTTNKFCVEFGFNSNNLTGGSGSNVARLVLEDKWNCLLMDRSFENHSINLYKESLTESNICSVFKKYNIPKDLDYLSIDVDSIDLWLMKAILKGEYSPRLISVEYNSNFPIDMSVTVKQNATWNSGAVYGASMLALNTVAEEFNYCLIAASKKLDLFFIKKDIIQENILLKDFQGFASIPNHYERNGPPEERINLLIEYPSMKPFSENNKRRMGWKHN